jgi:hypothetical protein
VHVPGELVCVIKRSVCQTVDFQLEEDKVKKLHSWSMTTAALAESSFPVHWIKHPKVNAKAWLLVTAAMVLPVVFALSLPPSKSYRAVAEDPQWVPSTTRVTPTDKLTEIVDVPRSLSQSCGRIASVLMQVGSRLEALPTASVSKELFGFRMSASSHLLGITTAASRDRRCKEITGSSTNQQKLLRFRIQISTASRLTKLG